MANVRFCPIVSIVCLIASYTRRRHKGALIEIFQDLRQIVLRTPRVTNDHRPWRIQSLRSQRPARTPPRLRQTFVGRCSGLIVEPDRARALIAQSSISDLRDRQIKQLRHGVKLSYWAPTRPTLSWP
jgi:hypothetical protein